MGVRYVLEGSVRRAGNRVRITGQLIEAENGRHLWADRYDGDLSDVFELQDEITRQIVGAIEPELVTAEAARLERKPAQTLAAWDLLIRALPSIWRNDFDAQIAAQTLLQQAIAAQPNYARAHALLGWSYLNMFNLDGRAPHGSYNDLAFSAAAKARTLDPEDAWGCVTLGASYARLKRPKEAEAAVREALDLDPNLAVAHAWLGFVYAVSGRPHDALPSLQRATRLSPRDPYLAILGPSVRAQAHFAAESYPDAVEVCRAAISRNPDHLGAWRVLAASFGCSGQTGSADEAGRELLARQPTLTLSAVERGSSFADEATRSRLLAGLRIAGIPE